MIPIIIRIKKLVKLNETIVKKSCQKKIVLITLVILKKCFFTCTK